jgi:hypothetical protein
MINGTRCVTTIRLNLRRAGDGPALPQLVGTDTAVPIRGHAARKRGLLERGVTAAVIPHSSNQGRLSRGRRRRSRRSPPGSGTAAASCASFPARWRSPWPQSPRSLGRAPATRVPAPSSLRSRGGMGRGRDSMLHLVVTARRLRVGRSRTPHLIRRRSRVGLGVGFVDGSTRCRGGPRPAVWCMKTAPHDSQLGL